MYVNIRNVKFGNAFVISDVCNRSLCVIPFKTEMAKNLPRVTSTIVMIGSFYSKSNFFRMKLTGRARRTRVLEISLSRPFARPLRHTRRVPGSQFATDSQSASLITDQTDKDFKTAKKIVL